ncbi:MAG TPA: hypothetical protein VF746_14615 [Longimicrobium sp.]|jgi:hypothetical protein
MHQIIGRSGARARPRDVERISRLLRKHGGFSLNTAALVEQVNRAWKRALMDDPEAAQFMALERSGFLDDEQQAAEAPLSAAPATPRDDLVAILAEDVAGLYAARTRVLSERAAEELEALRTRWIEGRGEEVLATLKDRREDFERGRADAAPVRARFLRFEATVLLAERGDANQAEALLAAARKLDQGGDDSTQRALIALLQGAENEALAILGSSRGRSQLNIAAGIHLSAGRLEEATALLDIAGDPPPNSETHRLRALLALAKGELEAATESVEACLREEPRSFEGRFLRARISYSGALSPALDHTVREIWPFPVDPRLIREDERARALLESAAEQFSELTTLADGPTSRRVQCWEAAALMAHAERHAEGVSLMQALVNEEPAEPVPILWVSAYGLEFDRDRSISALEALGAIREPAHTSVLADLYSSRGDHDAAQAVIRSALNAGQVGPDGLLYVRWVQLLASRGKLMEAERSLARVPEHRRWSLRLLVSGAAESAVPYLEHRQLLSEAFEATRYPGYLLDAATLAARRGDWEWVVERVGPHVAHIDTTTVVHLVASGHMETGSYREALEKLVPFLARGLAEPAQISLRALAAGAHAALGYPREAAQEMEWVVARRDDTTSNLALAQYRLLKADLHGVLAVARRLIGRTDVPTEALIWLAELMAHEDRELGRGLWRQAGSAADLPEDAVVNALMTAFQLGLDDETRELTERMTELAAEGRGGVQKFRIEEFQEIQVGRNQALEEAFTKYGEGALPVHTLASIIGEPLSHLLHRLPELNEDRPSPTAQFSPRTRHGERSKPLELPAGASLRMDTSTLVLAHHLELLSDLVNEFGMIRLPYRIAPLLVAMENRRRHHQPGRLEAYRAIRSFVAGGRMRVVDPATLIPSSEPASGAVGANCLVVFASEVDRPTDPIPEGWSRVTLRDVIRSLEGVLRADEAVEILQRLGVEGQAAPGAIVPRQGGRLHFTASTVELLAGSAALAEVCDRFDVTVEDTTVARWADNLEAAELASRDAEWIAGLRLHLAAGFEAGTYRLVPEPTGSDDVPDKVSGELAGLAEVLAATDREGEIACVDDRHISKVALQHGQVTVDVMDLLAALRARGRLSDDAFFSRVNRLRAGNIRYLPLTREEVLFHLNAATVRESQVIESRGLGVLRRYVAACMLDPNLQPVDPAARDAREGPFVLSVTHACEDALMDLWSSSEVPPEDREARAEWLRENLYMDLGLSRAAILTGDQPQLEVTATGLSMLLLRGLPLVMLDLQDDGTRMTDYAAWVFQHIVEPRIEAEPELGELIGGMLASRLTDLSIPAGPEVPEEYCRLLGQRVLAALPEPIRGRIRDRDLLERVGWRFLSVVNVEGKEFALDAFADASAAALRGDSATIESLGEEPRAFTFRPSTSPGLFEIVGDGGVVFQPGPNLSILSNAEDARRAALAAVRPSLDMSDRRFAQLADRITALSPGAARLEALTEASEHSMAQVFPAIEKAVKAASRIKIADLLPPDPAAVLDHLRIDPDASYASFAEAWESAGAAWTRELPLAAAVIRCVSLPVPPPRALLDRLDNTDPESVRRLVRERFHVRRSPVSAINSLYLLGHLARREVRYGRLARRLAREILSPVFLEEAEAFGRVLAWLEEETRDDGRMAGWPAANRLAMLWCHAHRIFVIYGALGASAEGLQESFSRRSGRLSTAFFDRSSAVWADRAHPRHFDAARLLLSGVATASVVTGLELTERERQLAAGIATVTLDSGKTLRVSLYRDLSGLPDGMGTYLWPAEGAYQNLLGAEAANLISRESLRAGVKDAAQKLRAETGAVGGWVTLAAVLGDDAADPDACEAVRAVIAATDFAKLIQEDACAGFLALSVAATQLAHYGSAAERDALMQTLTQIALAEPTSPGPLRPGEHDTEIVEALARLSLSASDPETAVAGLAAGLDGAIRACPRLALAALHAVQRLWSELPLHLASRFTRLLLYLRATAPALPR